MGTIRARIIGYLIMVTIGVFTVVGCSKNKVTNSTPPVTHSAHFHDISIANFTFTPDSLAIPVGDTVLWTNNQNVTHTVTSDTGNELGQTVPSGSTYQHIFLTSNTFPYHCSIHTFMHGKVVVQ